MTKVTIKQLRYYEALARHGHFGRAAATCAISQPALSMQIKELEQALGTVLFERGPRQVRLTHFGEAFGPRVREILRGVDELGDLARATQRRLTGRLRLGIIPTIAPYLLPSLVQRLNQSHPGLDLHVRETMTPRLLQELADGRIDAAVVALPVSEPAFDEVALFREPFVLIRPASDADLPVPSPRRLREMRLLLLEEGHCFRDQALSFCKIQSARPWDGLEGSSLSTLVQMVGAGIGVTLLPQMAVQVETRAAAVSVSRFAGPEPARTVGMIWRRSSPLASQLTLISKDVQTATASLQADPSA